MRCRIHVDDNSSSLGVCASCLRHRLLAVSAHGHPPTVTQYLSHETPESPQPQPLPVFQNSVSPPNNRRDEQKNDVIASDQRFFSTPQQDDVVAGNQGFFSTPQARRTLENDIVGVEKHDKSKKKSKKFSLFHKLFRSRSDKVSKKKSNLTSDGVVLSPKDSNTTSSSSSPFNFLIKRNKRNQQQDTHSYSMLFFSEAESSSALAVSGKGVRKSRRSFSDNDYYHDHDHDHGDKSPTESDYSSESSGWRKTPVKGKGGKVLSSSGTSGVGSGLGFCLSPLVRASPSPSKFWGQNSAGMLTPEKAMYSTSEFRKAKSPMYLTNAASFCKSRSRKMADFGRPMTSHH